MARSDNTRWRTIAGAISARDLERACRAHGVRFDRARRTYWQRERLFPLSAERWAARPAARGGFHPEAVHLVVLVDAYLSSELPYRPVGARSSLVPLRLLLAQWWSADLEASDDPTAAEARFYARVAADARATPGARASTVHPPRQARVPTISR